MLAATSFNVQSQVLELQQTVVIPQTLGTPPPERSWVPGAVVEVPPIFATGPLELRRSSAADPFTKCLERRMKRRYPYLWKSPPIHLELSRQPNESCTADYLPSEYREAVEQFDDLRFQFAIDPDFDPDAYQ